MDESSCPICLSPYRKRRRCYVCFAAKRKTGRILKCGICEKEFYAARWDSDKRYCSYDCGNEAKRIQGPGARYKRPDGYVQVYFPKHPDAGGGRYVMEHRLVAEQKLGRRLKRTEHVHHINCVKDDNRPENLEVMSMAEHGQVSSKRALKLLRERREELEEYRRRYGPLSQS